jgi:Tfp pilus assembly protein PilW
MSIGANIRGIGLLELMLSLAVVALVMVMATRYFIVVREQQRVTQALQMAATTQRAAHTWGIRNPGFPTGGQKLIEELVKAQLLPASYLAYRHPWGGFFDFKSENGATFTFVFNGISAATCELLRRQLVTTNNPPKMGDVTAVDCS